MLHEEHSIDLRDPNDRTKTQTITPPPDDPTHEQNPSWLTLVWETLKYAVVAAMIIIPIRTFVAQPFIVSGNSMFPTYHNGEYLIVNELVKYVGDYQRGDVVILRYPNDPSKYFIKRVIGLPGETVTIRNGEVSITSPTRTTPLVLNEPYVKNPKLDSSSRTLDMDEYFVMGDNRDNSYDSRFWGFVDHADILGKAFILYWSWDIETPLLSATRLTSIRWGRIGDVIQ